MRTKLKQALTALLFLIAFIAALCLASCQTEPQPAVEEWLPHGKCTPETCEFKVSK